MKRTSVMKEALASCTKKEEILDATLRVKQEMGDELMAVINSYHAADWPILAAVMRITTETLVKNLNPIQRMLYEVTVEMTSAVSAKVEVNPDE